MQRPPLDSPLRAPGGPCTSIWGHSSPLLPVLYAAPQGSGAPVWGLDAAMHRLKKKVVTWCRLLKLWPVRAASGGCMRGEEEERAEAAEVEFGKSTLSNLLLNWIRKFPSVNCYFSTFCLVQKHCTKSRVSLPVIVARTGRLIRPYAQTCPDRLDFLTKSSAKSFNTCENNFSWNESLNTLHELQSRRKMYQRSMEIIMWMYFF